MATDLTLCRKTRVSFKSVNSGETIELLVPTFLYGAFEIIDKQLETEGIFRKCGSIARQKLLRPCLYSDASLPQDTQILDAASLVKEFFRLLSVPVFTRELQSFFVEAAKQQDDKLASEVLLNLIHLLPTDFWHCLAFLMRKLHAVAQHQDSNLMKSDSLAKLFAVNLFRDEDLASVAFDQNLFNLKTRVVELLINNAERIGILSEYEKVMTPDMFASLVPSIPAATKNEQKKEKNPFVKRLKKAIVDPMKHLTNMNGHLETPVTRGSAYNKRKSLNLASNMARRQNSAGGADRFVPSEFDEAGGYTKLADDSQRRISRSVDDIDCLHDDMGRLRKTECVLRTSKKKPDKVEVSVGGDASGKNRRRSDKKSIFGKTKKRSRSSSTEHSNHLQLPKATGQHFSNVKTEAKWYATSTEESDGELLSDFEAYNTVHRTDIPDTKMDNQTPMMGNLTESAGLGSRSSLKDKRRSVSESVLNAMERLKTGGRLMRGKPNSVQVGLVPPPLPTTMKRRPSRSLDSINRTFDRQFDRGETSTPRPNGSGLEFFGDFKLRPVEIALEDIFTPGSAAFDGLKVSFDAGFSDLVEEVLAKQISLVSNRSTTEDQNLRTPGSRRNRSQSATELRSFCEPSESDPKKSSNPIESPGSRSKFVVDETDFLHSEMRRMAIIQMKSPGASHEESGNDVFNSHLNSPPFHDAESLAVPLHPKACDRPSLAFIRQERGGMVKNTVEKFNRLSSGSSSSSVTTANQSHSFVANRSRRRYGVSERSTNHCEPDDQNSEDTSFVSSNSHWKRRSRRTYGYTPPAWLGEKQRRSKGSDRRSTIASSVSNEPTEDICGKVVLLDLNDTPTMNRYNTRLSVGRNRTESNSSGRGLANAISLSNISVGPSPSSFESDTSRNSGAPVRRTQSDRLNATPNLIQPGDQPRSVRRQSTARKTSLRGTAHSRTRKRRARDTPRKATM